MRTVLVPMNGLGDDSAALQSAGAVARLFDSHVCGFYVRFDAEAAAKTAIPIGSRGPIHDWLKSVTYEDEKEAIHARHMFETFLRTHDAAKLTVPGAKPGPSGEWREVSGDFVDAVVAASRFHDLVVCARPPEKSASRNHLSAILMWCGRPLLLAADAAPKAAHTVVVAWKNTREAAHAVTAAMPLLQKARHVVVVTAHEEDQAPIECADCADRLAASLRWHGIRAEGRMVVLEGRDAPSAVLDAACEHHADLLVMGGYGHSRAQETIFGGFTRRVLKDAPLPVFICH